MIRIMERRGGPANHIFRRGIVYSIFAHYVRKMCQDYGYTCHINTQKPNYQLPMYAHSRILKRRHNLVNGS